ncbi:pyrroline-5-carboxylate reductase [Candidatus Pantoea edessiphila]|uniref:Pyrroline-5-carboxylate reductase n=1 Tax=Candidatus Pantoea edessiphila TaxID=2044610 RepID=A0A2P5SZJ0_9GAMM|nr:pyrroline-5-carboxylate reductase [Candidatus Pantoea edessiphila]PPI87723.1 pyrroline-5-carboxylate reductase [Candidatus Pantoea edessiphila]
MQKKIGFIGIGRMARSIIEGLLKNKHISSSVIWIYDHKLMNIKFITDKYNVNYCTSSEDLVQKIDILFITLKPTIALKVLKKIANYIKKDMIVVSTMAGITINTIEQIIGEYHKIIRVMPNIPSIVLEGMTAITPNNLLNQVDINLIVNIFKCIGKTNIIKEHLIHSVVGISSSAPAYVFMFIEAMATVAIKNGMTYSQAYQFAAQAVKGSAQMLLETKKHPEELKNMVCSPGGTTIEAIKILEKNNFNGIIMEAIQKCIIKSTELSKIYE